MGISRRLTLVDCDDGIEEEGKPNAQKGVAIVDRWKKTSGETEGNLEMKCRTRHEKMIIREESVYNYKVGRNTFFFPAIKYTYVLNKITMTSCINWI